MRSGKPWLTSTFIVLALTPIAAAEEATTAQTETVDPSGSWQWEYSFNDSPAEFNLDLEWDGKELTGKYTAFNNTTDIEETRFTSDNKLSFVSKREFNGSEFVVHFAGEAKPDEIVGTVAVDFGEGPREFDWTAKRVVDVGDVVGVWKIKVETPQGVVEPQITITRDGEKLHGDYVSPFGEREAKEVLLKDGELSWTIESNDGDDFDFQVIYRGKPIGNKIAGTGEFDFGGNTGGMDFTGERTPPKERSADSATGDTKEAG